MKKVIVGTIAVVLLLAVGFFVKVNKPSSTDQTASVEASPEQTVGGDRDEHGCIGSAGYSWCALKNKCLREWEEACSETAEAGIQTALAKKYTKSPDEVHISISKQDANFAAGSVSFGEGGPGENGIFLARKNNSAWEVVFDGNGSIDCAKMRQEYNFPDTILKPNFCD